MKTQAPTIEYAGYQIAESAMRLVARHPLAKTLSREQHDSVIASMKAALPAILDELFRDLREAPSVANYAVQSAVLSLAKAGLDTIERSVTQ